MQYSSFMISSRFHLNNSVTGLLIHQLIYFKEVKSVESAFD